ncbi:aromatic-ring-hydroxylating dioxygenase subunit beta [Leucobacter soli]|uniref:Biphenyl dioxygenase subunit beta n=1 Tax=Leucobacter soli TaxID=2812850 RepID=A0A916JXK2_9MICO|nr:3-phenylpropionate/cinnamic acid dioxygenase subunit beta [Leucobacter soli]CAG7608764.1 Biphenyl dioxygenase subunit beta [Leucobacter soli]
MSKLEEIELLHDVTQWFYREADLLDYREYAEWLKLLHPEVRYFIPLVRNVPRIRDTEFTREQQDNAWMDEGYTTLEKRVKQILTNIHWAEEPPSRVSHLITNTVLLSVEGEMGEREVQTRSRVFVYQNRIDDEVNHFVGKRIDTLVESEGGWLLKHRTVHLEQSVLLAKALTVFI